MKQVFSLSKLRSLLHRSVYIHALVNFRILFGLLLAISTIRFMYLGWIEDHYTDPIFQFKYYGFEWINPVGVELMYCVHILLIISSLCLCFGLFYRWSAIFCFLFFTYTELIDLSYYLNHYYYVSMVCLLMIFLPAHRYFSLDVYFKRVVPAVKVASIYRYIIVVMAAIVYCYAGMAKINYAWLIEAMPLRIWLPAHNNLAIIGPLLSLSITPYLFSWCGMIFDLSIPFFLLNRRTRGYAFIAVVVFHTLTGILFQIGVFPLVMIASASLFFSDEFHKGVIDRFCSIYTVRINSRNPISCPSWKTTFFCLFIGFHLLFPWRYLLYDGNVFWTEEGYRFSWRVMLMEKSGTATFYIQDGSTDTKKMISNRKFLNPHQEKQMSMQADMIVQFAHFLGQYYREKSYNNPIITVDAFVTLNGSPNHRLISPDQNLLEIDYRSWQKKHWILAAPTKVK